MSGPDRPIGVFDSGVGGLTVLKELRRQLPNESTVYLGDEARMPYGEREAAEVVEFTRKAVQWFEREAQPKLILIACNTATAVALEIVREESSVPVIGVIRPGASAALTATSRRAVGVLATRLTVRSGAYFRALRDLDPLIDVIQQPAPKLVPLIEAGGARSDEARAAVREYIAPMLSEGAVVAPGVDTILLGCTHYPLVRWAIEQITGPVVRVVDSATTTALAVREVLDSHRLRATGDTPTQRVHATGSLDTFVQVARAMFGQATEVHPATLS
ncbi:MAG: glutamate racemase [Chloroflexi bacterium]|nr:glutamate racemase [Chloroflexota bacterium]